MSFDASIITPDGRLFHLRVWADSKANAAVAALKKYPAGSTAVCKPACFLSYRRPVGAMA